MKNKKFSQWLHRLPVLLTALLILVSPMAVPADASVLVGDAYSVYNFDYASAYLPGDHYSVGFALTAYQGNYLAYAFYSDTKIEYTPLSDAANVNAVYPGTLYVASIPYDMGSAKVFDFRDADFEPVSMGGYTLRTIVLAVGNLNTSGFSFQVSPDYVTSAGVLDTFSGVGSWISGAVQNISTMFWTAESGMTVLGYLAVASLALAVILLIFYLIAGWLKFH